MIFRSMAVGPIEANCYILADEPPAALVIDPGGDGDEIIACLEMYRLAPELIVNTHGHFDHLGANAELRARWPDVKIGVGREDAGMLGSSLKNMSAFFGTRVKSPPADRLLDDEDRVAFARWDFRVLHVPGHTPGGICLHVDDLDGEPALFSGDTLLWGALGRSDIPGGDAETLVDHIKRKLLALPDNTIVYPGHGPRTTIAEEKANNPFVR